MTYNRDIHHRRSIRLKGYDYSAPGAYFITICVHNRENLLGDVVNGIMQLNPLGDVAHTIWNELPQRYPDTALDEFVIMPNHIHGILTIHPPI